jgi:hypothetical protein
MNFIRKALSALGAVARSGLGQLLLSRVTQAEGTSEEGVGGDDRQDARDGEGVR